MERAWVLDSGCFFAPLRLRLPVARRETDAGPRYVAKQSFPPLLEPSHLAIYDFPARKFRSDRKLINFVNFLLFSDSRIRKRFAELATA